MQATVPAAPGNVSESPKAITLHILCPFLPPPSRFTFNNVPLSTTIAQLRVQLAHTILGQTVPTTSRLIFLGRPLTMDSATLEEVLAPVNVRDDLITPLFVYKLTLNQASAYTFHFVPQPPVPTQTSWQASSTGNRSALGEQNRLFSIIGEQNPTSSNTGEQSSSAIEARTMQGAQHREAAPHHLPNSGHDTIPRRIETPRGSVSTMTRLRRGPSTLEDVARDLTEVAGDQGMESRLEMLRARWGQPRSNGSGVAQPPNTAATERREDQAHPPGYNDHLTSLTRTRMIVGGRTQSPNTTYPIYQTFNANGSSAVVLPSAHLHRPVSLGGASSSRPNINVAFGANANPADPAMAENLVRQAVINNQRRQDAQANAPGIGHHLSRLWLFIRLYLFCYMISAPGSWTRILFVFGALLISLLSDTDIPQMLHGLIVQPVQRHLERLAHMGGPGQPTARDDGARNGFLGEILDYFRRTERSIVLLLASLVPGVGERQVEARNAAEAEAERVRREASEREQEQDQNQEQQQQVHIETTSDTENAEQTQQAAAPMPASVPADS